MGGKATRKLPVFGQLFHIRTTCLLESITHVGASGSDANRISEVRGSVAERQSHTAHVCTMPTTIYDHKAFICLLLGITVKCVCMHWRRKVDLEDSQENICKDGLMY